MLITPHNKLSCKNGCPTKTIQRTNHDIRNIRNMHKVFVKNNKIAVVAPHIGTPSETFIMRHMSDLVPNQTVVVVNKAHPSCDQTSWNYPVFELSNHWKWLHNKIIRLVARRLHFWKPHHQLLPAIKFTGLPLGPSLHEYLCNKIRRTIPAL